MPFLGTLLFKETSADTRKRAEFLKGELFIAPDGPSMIAAHLQAQPSELINFQPQGRRLFRS